MGKFRLSPEFREQIREHVNLIDVVSEHVVLRKSGSNYVGLCPFHSERSPSFYVSEAKQLYNCHGCQTGGDLFKFVQDVHGLSFYEAIEELAARAKIKLPDGFNADKNTAKTTAEQEKQALAFKLNRFVAAYYHHRLTANDAEIREIADYLTGRGVTTELARNFYVGVAPPGWDGLSTHLVEKKAPLPLAMDLGLIRPSPQPKPGSAGYFDLFRGRAMFPIMDTRGRVCGFGGRTLHDQPKYLNSPESAIFQKSKLVFGMYQAQKHIREKDEVILVEGYFDVLAMHAAGFANAVATCGTALTPDHLKQLTRLGTKVIVLFDGDRAGIAATERAMETGLDLGIVLYGARVPGGQDPDEFIRDHGREKMEELLKNARPLLDARIEELGVTASLGTEEKTQAVKQIAQWLARFRDPVGTSLRLEAAVRALGVSREIFTRAIGKPSASARPTAAPPALQKKPAPPPGKISPREKVLLAALVRGGDSGQAIVDALGDLPPKMTFSDLFDYFPARAFVASLLAEPSGLEQFRKVPEEFFGEDLDAQVRSIVTEALISQDPPFESEDFRLALGRSLGRVWARFSQQIKAAIAQAEANKDAGLDKDLVAALMKEYLDVQRKIKEFNSFYDEA